MVIWITGLPGAGKTTIARALLEKLKSQRHHVVLLDGDELRQALQTFDYDPDSRVGLGSTYSRLAKLLSEQGTIVICATVSMFDSVRQWNRDNIQNYFEIYLQVAPETLTQRNQKQLYHSNAESQIKPVVAENAAFEEPKMPDLVIKNDDSADIKDMVDIVWQSVQNIL